MIEDYSTKFFGIHLDQRLINHNCSRDLCLETTSPTQVLVVATVLLILLIATIGRQQTRSC